MQGQHQFLRQQKLKKSPVSAPAKCQVSGVAETDKLKCILHIAKSSRFQVQKVPLTHLTEDRSCSSLPRETVGRVSNPPQSALVQRFLGPKFTDLDKIFGKRR